MLQTKNKLPSKKRLKKFSGYQMQITVGLHFKKRSPKYYFVSGVTFFSLLLNFLYVLKKAVEQNHTLLLAPPTLRLSLGTEELPQWMVLFQLALHVILVFYL